MLNFDRRLKADLEKPRAPPRDNVAVLKAEVNPLVEELIKAENERHPDGKFKLGPAGSQKKLGEMAFQAAHDHLYNAEKAAMAGDQEQTMFHTNMAQQYANVGAQNHMMGGYLKNPTTMSGAGAQGPAKAKK